MERHVLGFKGWMLNEEKTGGHASYMKLRAQFEPGEECGTLYYNAYNFKSAVEKTQGFRCPTSKIGDHCVPMGSDPKIQEIFDYLTGEGFNFTGPVLHKDRMTLLFKKPDREDSKSYQPGWDVLVSTGIYDQTVYKKSNEGVSYYLDWNQNWGERIQRFFGQWHGNADNKMEYTGLDEMKQTLSRFEKMLNQRDGEEKKPPPKGFGDMKYIGRDPGFWMGSKN